MDSYRIRVSKFIAANEFFINISLAVFSIIIGIAFTVYSLVNGIDSSKRIFGGSLIIVGLLLVLIAFLTRRLNAKLVRLNDKNNIKNRDHTKNRRNFLLYLAAFLIPVKDRDFEIGNMIERFEKDKKRFGPKRATKLLAFDVIASAYPLAKRAGGLIVRTILRTLGLYKIYKMFFG